MAEPISSTCPKCGKAFKLPAELAGKKIVCKGCNTQFLVTPSKVAVAAAAKSTAPPPAPASAPPPDEAPIPLDDAPIPLDDGTPASAGGGGEVSAMPDVKVVKLDKLKHTSTGEYMVVKVFLGGKMVHAAIEATLNEVAADGWLFVQGVPKDQDMYLVFRRKESAQESMHA